MSIFNSFPVFDSRIKYAKLIKNEISIEVKKIVFLLNIEDFVIY